MHGPICPKLLNYHSSRSIIFRMSNYTENMQFTPPSAARKRRAGHPEQDCNTDDSSHSSNGNQTLVWQQAFKRLRVNDQENYMYFPSGNNHAGQTQPTWPQQHVDFNGSNVYSTPPSKQPAQEPPSETEYKRNNQVLGQLHRERRLREQDQLRRLVSNPHEEHDYDWNSSSSFEGDEDSGMMMESPAEQRQVAAVHLFGTPLSMRRRTVVHLQTDSKLE
jgi:hypothetical protein